MEDNFDNELKKQGDAYKVQPREWVWPRVEAELDKKKDRRIAAWWWMTPLALLLLGGGYLLIANKKTPDTIQSSTTTPLAAAKKAPAEEKGTVNDEKSNAASNKKPTDEEAATLPKNGAEPLSIATNNTTTDKSKIATPNNQLPDYIIEHEKKPTTKNTPETLDKTESDGNTLAVPPLDKATIKPEPTDKQGHGLDLNPVNTEEKNSTKKAILKSGNRIKIIEPDLGYPMQETDKSIANNKVEAIDSATVYIKNTITKAQPDSIASHLKKIETKEADAATVTKIIPVKKEVVWTINTGIGMANNKYGNLLPGLFSNADKMYADMPQSNVGSGPCVGCIIVREPLAANSAGIAISLSVQRSQWIASRWQWLSELGFQYQQTRQHTGNRRDSNFYAPTASFSSAAYSYYYPGGSAVDKKGYNSRLFIGNQLAFALLKNKKLMLSAGLYTGVNISDSYLVPDKNYRLFVEGSGLYKHWFMGGEMGLRYTLTNKWLIGLNGRTDFTRSFYPPDGNKQYWKSWQLQVGIPVFKQPKIAHSKPQ